VQGEQFSHQQGTNVTVQNQLIGVQSCLLTMLQENLKLKHAINATFFSPWRLSSAYFLEVRHKDSLWISHARCQQNSRITALKFNCRLAP
jgi:hypothetical protein